MAIDLFELYEELSGLVNTRQGGHVRLDRNFLQWVYQISIQLFEEKFTDWGKSQKLVDDMSRPFLTSVNLQVEDGGKNYGIAAFPPDYGHYSSARYFLSNGVTVPQEGLKTFDACGQEVDGKKHPAFVNKGLWEAMQSQEKALAALEPVKTDELVETPIDLISNDRWGAALSHRFAGPTIDSPKITQFDKGFKVAPKGVKTFVLDYLRVPAPLKFSYKVVAGDTVTGEGDYIEYDKANSLPLEWSTLVRNEFLTRLEKKYGKFIREDFIWQTSESDRRQMP